MQVAIIADDLTGAMDSGVQLVGAGYRTAVAFCGAPLPPRADLEAVAADTDSRPLDPEDARERVLKAARSLRNARLLFKKLDSTLRGQIAVELEAALEASGRRRAVVAPAFPATGRTTRGGVQLFHGVPVHKTGFAHDPRTPVRGAHIPSLLADLGPVTSLGVSDLAEPGSVRRALRGRYIVVDAETDAHLEALVRGVPDPAEVLWAGSAGLAHALGRVHPGPLRKVSAARLPGVRRVLVVVGTMNQVTCEQRRRLVEEGGVEEVIMDPARGPAGATAACRDVLAGGRSVVLRPAERRADSERVVEGLAEVAARLSREGLFDALVLTGGDTAVRVARRLGGRGILIEREIEPGVPLGALDGPLPYRVITKAGGFGAPDTLGNALRQLLGDGKEAG